MSTLPDASFIIPTECELLTREDGRLAVPAEFRSMAALFADGSFFVSDSHRASPLIEKVRQEALRLKPPVQPRAAIPVDPEVIHDLYHAAARRHRPDLADDNHARQKLHEIFAAALRVRAADIHIETQAQRTLIQLGTDGGLAPLYRLTRAEGDRLVEAVFQNAESQSGSQRSRQEPSAAMLVARPGPNGQGLTFPSGLIQARCEWSPTAENGVYLVIRLHYAAHLILGTDARQKDPGDFGFNERQTLMMGALRRRPYGLWIVAGPVNHGKTTTLRWLLNRRMIETDYRLNCLMIEDPPEGGVAGARQLGFSATQGDEKKREETFKKILRSVLRLSPNIVMLGEIRDLESAEFAIRMALTGRQVYSTLHVYDALTIPKRLTDLGLDPALVFDHRLMRGLMAQRLLRRLCPACKIPIEQALLTAEDAAWVPIVLRLRVALTQLERRAQTISSADRFEDDGLATIGGIHVADPKGCAKCAGDGRLGRIVTAEIIEADATFMDLLSRNLVEAARDYWLSENGIAGTTMMDHGLEHVRAGLVDPNDLEAELGPLAGERDIMNLSGMVL